MTRILSELRRSSLNQITLGSKIKEFFQNKSSNSFFLSDIWFIAIRISQALFWKFFFWKVFNHHCSKSVEFFNTTRKKLVLKRVFLNKVNQNNIMKVLKYVWLVKVARSVLILMAFIRNHGPDKNQALAKKVKVTIKKETVKTKNRQKSEWIRAKPYCSLDTIRHYLKGLFLHCVVKVCKNFVIPRLTWCIFINIDPARKQVRLELINY